jgi:diguanylate cyclase (GGDEF)-like protein/PAS domain S-box-containing protein
MEYEPDLPTRLAALRVLHRVVAGLNATRGLGPTLQAVADGVVSCLGFRAAAVNVVRADGDLEVAAVAGGAEVREALAGKVGPREAWDSALDAAEAWGSLRFVSHRAGDLAGLPRWSPRAPDPAGPQEWHPRDALFAPLCTPEGEFVGVLSLDMPEDGRRPGAWQRELLEMFAQQAAIAVDNARLRAETLRAVARLESEHRALRASEESFRQAFENAPSGMAMTGLQGAEAGRLVRVNDALCRLLGYSEVALHGMGLPALVHTEDRRALDGRLLSPGRHEVRLTRREGPAVWVSLHTSVIPDPSGEPLFLLTHVEDIEERKRHEQHLAHRASHDALTGLPNREELRSRLERLLGSGASLAVLFCDLDGFKAINDRHGHHVGDVVLAEVARRLRQAVRDEDTVARVGGDEFVVVAAGLSRTEGEALPDRLRTAFTPPIACDGKQLRVSASFGVSWTDAEASAEALLRAADREMYQEKRAALAAHLQAGLPGESETDTRRAG